ncbi:MAG: hypothetical protein AB8B50_21220 [Pirellulaceae bacterium]
MKRRILVALSIALIVVLVAPSLASRLMRSRIAAQLSDETGLDIEIGSLTASWFTSARVSDLSAATRSGETVLQCEQIQTEKNLLGLLIRGTDVGSIHVQNPHVHIPLDGDMKSELVAALQQIDPRKGLLRKIVNPDGEAIVQFQIHDGQVDVRTSDQDDWHTTVTDLNAIVDIDHRPDLDDINVQFEETQIVFSPELGDHGLQFVAPVLAGAVDLEGQGTLQIPSLHVQPQNWQEMELDGSLIIEEASANIQAPLLRKLVGAIGSDDEQSEQSDQPQVLELASQSCIEFEVADGRAYHEGLKFGLTDILPNTLLTSEGSVGFDETLDFEVGLEIPFDKMGDGPLLAKIGTPKLTIPVTGTFQEPQVAIGKGKAVGSLIRDVVRSATDDQIDPAPLLEKIGELGLLKGKLGSKNDSNAQAPGSGNKPEESGAEASNDEEPKKSLRERLRDRLRNRRSSDTEDQ